MEGLRFYLLWQAVGWVGSGLVLAWLVVGFGLPSWIWLALAALVLKDLLLLPAMRRAWGPPRVGAATLIGARGTSVERLAPAGLVRIGGELWAAEVAQRGREIAGHRPVVVRGRRGITLLVDEAETR